MIIFRPRSPYKSFSLIFSRFNKPFPSVVVCRGKSNDNLDGSQPAPNKAEKQSYSRTIQLPKFPFNSYIKGIAPKRELQIQEQCKFSELYQWQQTQSSRPLFVLHDGPPYANGEPHVGHALNKIMKDIVLRYKLMQGYRVHYVPGWDCHGMPIEQKALEKLRLDASKLKPMEIRTMARHFAENAIGVQKSAFQSWAVMGDWNNSYYSFDKDFEINQLEIFYQMYKKGYIFRDYMPIHWSPSSKSALAEAEIEYNREHVSTSAFVKFPLSYMPDSVRGHFKPGAKVYVVIWTTTPWTLPLNEAIAFGPSVDYSFVRFRNSQDILLLSKNSLDNLVHIFGGQFSTLYSCKGRELQSSLYTNPITNEQKPMLPVQHLVIAKGTSLVHLAPAHGPEDFQVALQHGLSTKCHVDEDGRYAQEFDKRLAGKSVLTEGNEIVMQLLLPYTLHSEKYVHSYPYDWRTKQPLLFRACKQWFVDISKLRERAEQCLKDVALYPSSAMGGLQSALNLRPYWCISRQRAWGLPMPVFYDKDGQPVINRAIVTHLQNLMKKHGSDCWWQMSMEELLPEKLLQEENLLTAAPFQRSNEVLDIWFDSGSTWAHVLKDTGYQADVYLEGADQLGAWFQTSLLTSVAVQDRSPYKSLIVHGFAVDSDGKKMSKSLGNVIHPQVVVHGGKDQKKEPAYGVDVLRWWVTQRHADPQVKIGPQILHSCSEELQKIRHTLRYLVGNIHDYQPEQWFFDSDDLSFTDKYMLHKLYKFLTHKIDRFYDSYRFDYVVTELTRFIYSEVSFYILCTKDRLYCNSKNNLLRYQAQFVIYELTCALMSRLAPIVPHLAEEVYQSPPFNAKFGSVFKTCWSQTPQSWCDDSLENDMSVVTTIRNSLNEKLGTQKAVDFDVIICAKSHVFGMLKTLQEEMSSTDSALVEMLGCSTVSILSCPPLVIPDEATIVDGCCSVTQPDGSTKSSGYLLIIIPPENYLCDRCRRNIAESGSLCKRCSTVLDNML